VFCHPLATGVVVVVPVVAVTVVALAGGRLAVLTGRQLRSGRRQWMTTIISVFVDLLPNLPMA